MISYIIPHKDRVDLLRANLQTLLNQTCKEFEVVIVDNSGPSSANKLRVLISEYRARGVRITVLFIDPSKHPLSHPPNEFVGGYNPALSQNIGVKASHGDVICLTSPEVINSKTNVEVATALFKDGTSRFALGWIDERHISTIGSLEEGISTSEIKKICSTPGNGAMCRDDYPGRPWMPINYFLGFMRKDDFLRIGGVDEGFMRAIAWEDNFFAHCCEAGGMPATFNGNICGIHLTHSRGYQTTLENENKVLWESLRNTSVANEGREWGSSKYIVGEF